MSARQRRLGLLAIAVLAAAPAAAEPFEKVWCLRYAVAPDAPQSLLLAGAPPGETFDVPFAMCVAKSASQVVMLDAGFVNQKLGEPYGARDWVEYAPLLAEPGHEPRLFEKPEEFGFRRVSKHAIALVE